MEGLGEINEIRGSKRLLLNDPDAINNRLNNLERSLQQQQATILQQQATIQQLKQNNPQGYAAGQLFYSASSYPNRLGGAANMLCLPNNPKLSNKTAGGYSLIYGSEFEENFLRSDAVDEDIPCAFCRSLNTTSSEMFPGRNVCYHGWKTAYEGFVMSGYWGHRASSFICVDLHPDYVPGGKANVDGHRLYVTGTKCGSLSCPPYYDNLALNCVVCSK
ncbi:uncharacterized protein LOC127708186 [Mytilus californianus]|uniref:uncharacterized protein LOC127708186 n=1 Tax=Mytilus californianus TaxID=6549 RepID=UPI002246A98D|nr:uncharacterized protein LOC127708186 [Mytilus californianus]